MIRILITKTSGKGRTYWVNAGKVQFSKLLQEATIKLNIELVPRTAWFTNLRSDLKASEWDKIRRKCYAEAGYKCEICSGVGPKHPVECHEKWNFGDGKITLTGLIALCPSCHEVCHIGLAGIRGRGEIAMRHFMKVNGISATEAKKLIAEAFALYHERSKRDKWVLEYKEYLTEYMKS